MNDFFEPNGNRDILDAPKSDVDISQLISWSQSVAIAIEPEIKHLQHQTKIHQESPFPADKNINDKLYLWNGDITNLKVQAIVNSTNEALNDRNELSCKIIRIGGLQLKEELERLKGCRTGDAKVTKGYLLPARYVIHTVGPKFNTKYQTAAESALHSCYYRTFALVKEFKIRTVALPAINSVRRSYPSHEGAHIALRTIRRFLEKNHKEVEAVVLVLEPVDFGIYELLLPLYFPRNVHEEEYALYYLPSSIGGPNGEPIIPERNIRISDKPLILPKSLSNPDKDDSFEEDADLATQLDSSIAVGQTSFARMHGDVDKKRKEAKRQQSMGIKVESDALTLEVQRKNKYERLLRKARTEDLRSIAAMRFLYTSGEDRMGHPIIIFVGFRCSFTNLDVEKAIMYLVHTMDPIVQREYSIVYFHTLTTPENHPSMQFLQQIYSILDYKYKKNLRNFYIVHPTFWTRVLSWWFTTFTTSGLKNKVLSLGGVEYLYSAIAPDQLDLPPEVMDYDMKIRLRGKISSIMFENVATFLLNKYLGKYIQDLDSENLSIGIFSGTIQLTDLQLKTEALYELDLPIEVKAGCVGKISIDIPWMSLYSDPVLVHIEDILILAGPVSDRPQDDEKDKRLMRALKKKKLEDMEEVTVDETLIEKPRGFFENLIATIVNNIQVSIQNIHVRYEDVVSNPYAPLSCGIAVQAFTAITVNSKWKPTQIESEAKNIFKLIKLESFSIYWNPYCKSNSLVKSLLPSVHWKNVMKKGLATFSVGSDEFEFLVKPISAKAKMIFNKSSEEKVPNLLVDFVLQDAALQISRSQYLSILGLKDSFFTMSINTRYRKYKTTDKKVIGNAKEWWHYAYKAVLEEIIRPHSWNRIKAHRNTLNTYKDLYKQRLLRPADTELRMDLQKVEDKLDLVNILIAREGAKKEYIEEAPNRIQKKVKSNGSWLGWIVGYGSSNDLEEELEVVGEQEKSIWARLSAEEKQNLYQALGFVEDIPELETSSQHIAHKLNFTLANCTASLVTGDREIFIVTLTQFLSSLETRPGAQAFKISARTESFIVEGSSVENDLVPLITADNSMSGSPLTHVFALDLEKNPLHVNADFGLNINAEPIEVVYQEHSISQLLAFFAVPNMTASDFQNIALTQMHNLAQLSRAGLEYAVQKHQTVHLNVDLKSPYFVIPEHGTIQKGGSVLVLDAGRLTIKSDLQPNTIIPEDATKMELEEILYDRFSINLSEIQVLFADSGDEWRLAKQTPESDIHLVPKVRIQLLYSNSIRPDYKPLPRHKLNISVPSLKVSLSDRRLRLLMEFFQNIPLPNPSKIGFGAVLDEVDGPVSVPAELPDLKELQLEPSIEYLKRIRNLSTFLTPFKAPPLEPSVAPSSVMGSALNSSTSELSDEEPEEWARTVDLPGFDDNVSPSNNLFMLCRFIIGEMVVHLSRSSDHVDKPYLMLRLEKICADLACMDYGPALQTSLGGLQLIDKLHTAGTSGEYLELIKSESRSDIFTVLYRKVRASCPEFRSHFHQVEHSLVVDMNSLVVTFHREAFMTLGRFLLYVSEKLKPITKEQLYKSLISDISLDPTSLAILSLESDPPVPPGATKFSVSARVREVKVRLCDTDVNLAEIKVSGLEYDYVLKANDKMIIRVNLTEMSVDDLMEATLYTKILSIEDDKVFDFKYIKHSAHHKEVGSDENTPALHRDGTLRLRIGRMQVVVLQRFITELQRFLEPFVQPHFATNVVKSTEKVVRNQIAEAQHQSTKIQLSVDIHAPTVLFPQKSSSPNLLVFGLGDLNIENFFQEGMISFDNSDTKTIHYIDNILIRLSSLQMCRAIILLDGTLQCQEAIVEPVKLRLDMKRGLAPYHKDILMYDIRGSLDLIKVCIGQRDISTLLSVYYENFSEGEPSMFKPVSSPSSPTDIPTPTGHGDERDEDDPVKKLEQFLNSSGEVRNDARVSFAMEGLQVLLYTDVDEVLSSPVRDPTRALSKFEIEELSFTMDRKTDMSREYHFSLQSFFLEDTRPDSTLVEKRIFQSQTANSNLAESGAIAGISISMPPVIDMTYSFSCGDTIMNVVVEKMRFNISIPYILAVLKFFNDALPSHNGAVLHSVDGIPVPTYGEPGTKGILAPSGSYHHFEKKGHRRLPSDTTSGYHSTFGSASCDDSNIKSVAITGSLKKPEIILFADPSEENSQVLILKSDFLVDYNRDAKEERFLASVDSLQVLSCNYKKRRQTLTTLLNPCHLELAKERKFSEEEISVTMKVSAINARVSTGVIQTFLQIAYEIQADLYSMNFLSTDVLATGCSFFDFHDLWTAKPMTPNKFVMNHREPVCVKPSFPKTKSLECLKLTIPDVSLYIETPSFPQLFKRTSLPLLFVRTSCVGDLYDWSKHPYLKANVELEIMYYNEKVSSWEPLLEPVMEVEGKYRPWLCEIRMFRDRSRPILCRHDKKCERVVPSDVVDGDSVSGSSRILLSDSGTSSDSDAAGDEGNGSDNITVIRRKGHAHSHPPLHRKANSQRSHDSVTMATYPLDSDSETDDNILEKITSAFGHLFSGESSDDEDDDDETKSDLDDNNGDSPKSFNGDEDKDDRCNHFSDRGEDAVDGAIEEEGQSQQLATYLMINSRDQINFNVTPVGLNVVKEVLETFTGKPIADGDLSTMDGPCSKALVLNNFLGPQTKVSVLRKDDSLSVYNIIEEAVGTRQMKSSPEGPSTTTSSHLLVDLGTAEADYYGGDDDDEDLYSVASAISQQSTQIEVTSVETVAVEEDLTKKKERVSVEIEGFEKFQCLLPGKVATLTYALQPVRKKTRYYFLVDVDMTHGTKTVSAMSPLKIENHLTRPVHVLCLKACLEVVGARADDYAKNPFHATYVQLATLETGQVYNVPLLVAYHCQIYFQPAVTPADTTEYSITSEGLWWQDMEALQKQTKCLQCVAQKASFSIKASCIENKHIQTPAVGEKIIPNYTFHLHPPVILHNSLPYNIELAIKKTKQELRLEEGERIPLYDIEPNETREIQIEILHYLGLNWRGKVEVSSSAVEHRTIWMEPDSKAEASHKTLSLLVHTTQEHSLNVHLHAPYWIVNKTGLPIWFRGSSSEILYESPSSCQEPVLFRFKKHRRKKVKLRVYNSKWSHSFSIDVVGNRGVLICCDKERNKKYRKELRFMEDNEANDLWLDIDYGQCIPYWPETETMKIFVKHKDSSVVSQHFAINVNHTTVLRMENGSALCVEVTGGTENPVVISLFSYCPGMAPVRVENLCDDLFIRIHQKTLGQVTLLTPNQSVLYTWDDPTLERTLVWNLYNRKKAGFEAKISKDGWGQEKLSFHSVRQQMLLATSMKNRTSVGESSSDDDDSELEDGGPLLPRKTRKDKVVVYWVSYLDGLQRVLLFTQDERTAKQVRQSIGEESASIELFLSLNGLGVSLLNGAHREVAYLGAQSAPALWEVEVNHNWKLLSLELSTWLEDKFQHGQTFADLKECIQVDMAKMKLLKPFFASLRRTFNPALWCQYRVSHHHQLFHFKVHRIQIDNQLPDAIFPTVLYPMPLPQSVIRRFSQKPFLECELLTYYNDKLKCNTIKHFSLLAQEMSLKVDKGFLLSVFDIFSNLPTSFEEEAEVEKFRIKEDLTNIRASLQESCQLLLHLSFSPRGKVYRAVPNPTNLQQDLWDFFLSSIGATLTEVKDVEMKLAYFERCGVVVTKWQLYGDAYAHYHNQIVQQAYVLILGLDVLGNPYGLVKDFTKGLGDFFYEPFMGTVSGPDELAEGLARGARSFMGHVIGSTAGSIALISDSMGKAISVLSFDEDFKNKRQRHMQQQPSSLPDSLVLAAKSFAQGVVLGLTGVVVKPVTGAQYEGLEGFFKGIGKGVLGLLTKPAGGVFDMVTMAFDGIRRAAEMGEHVVVSARLPRFVNPAKGLKPYSQYQATGNRLLWVLSKGHYAETDVYFAHATLRKDEKTDIMLITNRHLFLLEKCRLWGDWDIQWVVRVDDIISVPKIRGQRIIIQVREDDALMSLAGNERYIVTDDTIVLEWIKEQIEKVLMVAMEDKPCAQTV